MRPAPELLYPFLRKEERAVMRVYDDAAPSKALKPGATVLGTLTAGVGHTGPDVQVGMTVTEAMVNRWLRQDVETARARLYSRVKPDVIDSLTDHQYAALLSFVFNLGANPSWTIWRALNAREYDAVPVQMARFVYAEGKKLAGLVKRRNAEIALWATAEPGSEPVSVPSSVTRAVETPPAPEPPKPLAKASAAAKIGAAGTATLAAANEVKEIVEPHAWASEWLQRALVLIVLVIVLASVAIWLVQKKATKA